ncbi:MAG: exodeoxyribonuclease III [Myxococcaceae bacterium]|nr:exodeoxyribonuclease III [Myxococcaceae bacterium]MBH2006496.1 exodeoxyribonuclease III [Myxococcaceae bacterium]
MRVYSWNVNGIRSASKKGLLDWLRESNGDIIGLQEVRAFPEQIPLELQKPEGYFSHFSAAERPGYSGVGLYSRQKPDEVQTLLNFAPFDAEGRVQIARFERLFVANIYFPNGQGKNNDNSRIPFKLAFYEALFKELEILNRAHERVLVIGDFNTAHTELDIARPKENQKTSGFTAVEREEMDRILSLGWVDTFRLFEKKSGHYSWWSQRAGARARNIGWRIDYVLASQAAAPLIQKAFILPEISGSDHCPVGVDVENP